MRFSSHHAGLAFAAAVFAAALTVAPVTADTSKGESGLTGAHSLRDSETTPGVNCRYKRITPNPGGYDYVGKLKTIDVKPPRMKAHSGTQRVGWAFIVQRAPVGPGLVIWTTTYTSPIQTRMTNASTNAAFDQMSVTVSVPTTGPEELPGYGYRVRVLMFWYNAAGFISGSSTHQVDWRKRIQPDFPYPPPAHTVESVSPNPCPAWMSNAS